MSSPLHFEDDPDNDPDAGPGFRSLKAGEVPSSSSNYCLNFNNEVGLRHAWGLKTFFFCYFIFNKLEIQLNNKCYHGHSV